MTLSLIKQARYMSEKLWVARGGFIFCNKKEGDFSTAKNARLLYDNFAFVIYYPVGYPIDLAEKMVIEMKKYCVANNLEFTEK